MTNDSTHKSAGFTKRVAFIGGGNMASALIGGLLRAGRAAGDIVVIEPYEAQRERLAAQFGVQAQAGADARLAAAATVVWAVKPQLFAQAAVPCAAHIGQALQVSVMAGVRTEAIARASGNARVVRTMPNTPALIGQGIAGLYARPEVEDAARAEVQALFAPTGQTVWVNQEDDLDAVTALSGSGPAYVFFFIEAMVQAATEMGLSAEQGRLLAQATFAGAAALAGQSPLTPTQLREQVTSKGGTTHAAITSLQAQGVGEAFVRALHAARERAHELGQAAG
jgi:pyrroline-5-carboxylate reductase